MDMTDYLCDMLGAVDAHKEASFIYGLNRHADPQYPWFQFDQEYYELGLLFSSDIPTVTPQDPMTIEAYEAIYPGQNIQGGFKDQVLQGMIQFDEETACMWGGPFRGNYAGFVIYVRPNETREWSISNPGHRQMAEYALPYEGPYRDFPVCLYMYGNDDTSHTKYFRTVEDAIAEVRFLAGKVCSMISDIQGRRYTPTN